MTTGAGDQKSGDCDRVIVVAGDCDCESLTPSGDWFSLGKVRNLCFFCSCCSNVGFHEAHTCMRYAYVLRHPPERQSLVNARMTVSGVYTKLFISFYIYIYIYIYIYTHTYIY